MPRRRRRSIVLLAAAAAALAACGDGTHPPSAAGRDAATADAARDRGTALADRTDGAPAESAHRAARPVVVTRAELDAFQRAWSDAGDDDARARVADAFAARGTPALDALLAALFAEPPCDIDIAFGAVLERLGAPAFAALARRLTDLGPGARGAAVEVLLEKRDLWRFDEAGADVCRALLALADADPDARRAAWLTICHARPAGGAVAAALGNRLAEGDDFDRAALAGALVELGTDAGPAAPSLLRCLDADDEDLRAWAREALIGIGSAEPSTLPSLRRMLEEGTVEQRATACAILATWGDAATPAGPALLRALALDDACDAAVIALGGMPEYTKTRIADALVVFAARGGDRFYGADDMLRGLLADPAAVRSLLERAPSLPGDAAGHALFLLRDRDDTAQSDAARLLLAHGDRDVRQYAAEVLADAAGAHPDERVLGLLDDPDPDVRAVVLRSLAGQGALDAERVRAMAASLRGEGEALPRILAIDALFAARVVQAADTDWLAAAARSDPDMRNSVLDALGTLDGPLPASLAEIAPELAAEAIGSYERERRIAAVARIPGGLGALLDAIPRWLDEHEPRGFEWDDALDAVIVLGPRADPVRARIAAWEERLDRGPDRDRVTAALAAIDGDIESLAESGDLDSVWTRGFVLGRLLASGAAGRDALVRRAGLDPDAAAWIVEVTSGDAAMRDAVRAAAAATPPHLRAVIRVGAARLASVLPATGPGGAAEVLARLAADPHDDVRLAAAEALDALAARDAAAVPLDAMAALLADFQDGARFHAARAASRLGRRGAPLVDALRAFAPRLPDADAVMAGLAAWRIGGAEDDARAATRASLSAPEEDRGALPWSEIGEGLTELPLDDGDLQPLLRRTRTSSFRGPSWPEERAILRALERFGRRAAGAVPFARELLASTRAWDGSCIPPDAPYPRDAPYVLVTDDAARLLVAIGPAAKPGIPDLRSCAARLGDPNGVLRDAIAKLRAMPDCER